MFVALALNSQELIQAGKYDDLKLAPKIAIAGGGTLMDWPNMNFYEASKSQWWFGISPEGFGSVAMLLNFIVSITIMKFTPAPPKEVQDIVERIRIPSGAGEATH